MTILNKNIDRCLQIRRFRFRVLLESWLLTHIIPTSKKELSRKWALCDK